MPTASFLRYAAVAPGELIPWEGNPRVHDDDALDDSVDEHGQYRTVVTRELPDGRLQLVAGHGTVNALARAGHATVRVEVHQLDDDQARAVMLVDNRASDRATYEEQLLLAQLDAAAASPRGLAGTGWDEDAYRKLLDSSTNALPEPGDAETSDGPPATLAIIVECDTEAQQHLLLERLTEEGYSCRALL